MDIQEHRHIQLRHRNSSVELKQSNIGAVECIAMHLQAQLNANILIELLDKVTKQFVQNLTNGQSNYKHN